MLSGLPVPGQEFVQAGLRLLGDAGDQAWGSTSLSLAVLLAVGAVVHPFSGARDPLPGRHHGGVADNRDQVAMPPRPGPQHAEAVLGIVEGDALDQPGQDLPVRGLLTPAGGSFHDVPSAGAVSSSLTSSKRRALAAGAARSSSSGS